MSKNNNSKDTIRMEIPYFQTPNDIFDLPSPIKIYHKIVYIYLCRCCNQGSDAFPSYNTIGKKCGMSRRKAIDIVAEMLKYNLLKKEFRYTLNEENKKENTSNLYTVNPPSAYCAPEVVNDVHHPSEHDAPYKEPSKEELYTIKSIEGSCLQETQTSSIPYIDFVMSLLANRNDIKHRTEIIDSVIYYFKKYRETFGEDHQRYKEATTKFIISTLEDIFEHGIYNDQTKLYMVVENVVCLKEVMDKHFEFDYIYETTYNLKGFLNKDILKNRYCEVSFHANTTDDEIEVCC